MISRCSLRYRGRNRRRGEAGGGLLFPILSFLSFCVCKRRDASSYPTRMNECLTTPQLKNKSAVGIQTYGILCY